MVGDIVKHDPKPLANINFLKLQNTTVKFSYLLLTGNRVQQTPYLHCKLLLLGNNGNEFALFKLPTNCYRTVDIVDILDYSVVLVRTASGK